MSGHRLPLGPFWLGLALGPLGAILAGSGMPQLNPILRVDADCTALAFSPDGTRVAYAVRRVITVRRVDMQRDDIWIATLDGKRKRIVNGEQIVQSPVPFSYAIRLLRWSADGSRLTVEMRTSAMIDERGNTEEGVATLLVDETGKEIKIQGADSIIPAGVNAAWLGDGVTIVYLREAVKPALLFSIHTVRPVAGRGAHLLEDRTFVAAAWDARRQMGVAIERDQSFLQPPKLVRVDLVKHTRQELAELDSYAGYLTISPTGQKAAYFVDPGTLEVRGLNEPGKPVRVKLALAPYLWAQDESRVLLRRGDRRSGNLVWVRLPDGEVTTLLGDLTFRDFELSPDGKWIAVTQPGTRALLVYPVQ